MHDWRDLNGDGTVDAYEHIIADEMLCTSEEEHIAMFGDAGDFEDDDEEDLEFELMLNGLDFDELSDMNEDDRIEALEDAGLDPDDFDFD